MKAGIVGANGYGGAELIRLLHNHPKVTLEMLISHSTQGQSIVDQYAHIHNIVELPLERLDITEIRNRVDILFFATPAGVTKDLLPSFLETEITCIDLSGDFRLADGAVYEAWYSKEAAAPDYLQQAVYGLPEFYRESIKNKRFISNPGCYPTAAILGMMPVVKEELFNPDGMIIVDGKTGVSGAGRKPSQGNLFSEINENTKAYKIASHQHTPEIEQVISAIYGGSMQLTFTPHLVPMTRGILCTTYVPLNKKLSTEDLLNLYKETYQNEPFVRVRPEGTFPTTKEVYGSNYCDIGITVDSRMNLAIVVSVIDNLVKGAAGQAVQNMNLLHNWDERTGLDTIPVYP